MKPFDLEKAKAGEPICTRDGRPAKFIAHVPEAHTIYLLIVLVNHSIYQYTDRGKFCTAYDHDIDLFMADPEPKKHKVWVYVIDDGSPFASARKYDGHLARKLVTITEGEFDEDDAAQ